MSLCEGCGRELDKPQKPGRPRKWCSERCRKRSYGDPCVDCGSPTRFGAETARVPEPRCLQCAAVARTVWTQAAIIAAIHDWNADYGEPPAASDWNPFLLRTVLHDESREARWHETPGRWPWHITVKKAFGSWNEAIAAAGFKTRPRGGGGVNVARRRSERLKVAA